MRKAQHKGKRVLASALCVGMLASMVPTQAFAADEQPVAAVVQEAAPAAEEALAEDAVSTETPAEESAAEETPAPAEDAPTEETPVEEAPAEEAALAPMDAPVEEALAAEETAVPAAQEAAAPQTAAARIATNVGVVPAGIDWADNVTANTFAEPYATVTAKDKAGNEYTVEVIPADTVYFIDSVAATGNDKMDNVQSTAAYAAAKALLGDQLLNGKSDQFYQGDATWGLVDTDAQTKGYTSSNADDKDYTGVYGKNNEAGETISYKFTLPAGKYKITTAHREWWGGQNRAMDLSLTTNNGTTVYASVPKQNEGAVTTKTGEFEITSEQVVTWTATTTGEKAPAVSWLAIERTGDAETPDTPVDGDNENFGKVLEEEDGLLTLYTTQADGNKTDISLEEDELNGYGKVLTLTGTAWNNKNGGHASINNAPSYFQRAQFTLLADLKVSFASGNDGKAAAFTIGKDGQSLHVFTSQGKIGYGANNGGVSAAQADLAGAKSGEWNAMALTYQETESGSKVVVYLNGEKAAEIADIGFKISDQSDLQALICRSFGTSYLMNGSYDNIVVQGTAMSEDEAKKVTAERLAAYAATRRRIF